MKNELELINAAKAGSERAFAILFENNRKLLFNTLRSKLRGTALEDDAEDILLEEAIKREIKKKVQRGKVEVFIFLEKHHSAKMSIDEKVVASYFNQIKALAKKQTA